MLNRLNIVLSYFPFERISFVALLCGVVCLFCSCTAEPLCEARKTLAVADSLRVNEGRLYNDSLALAEAYTLLGHWRLIYPDDYARACYYYGRMLRHRGDQVAAIRAFINGTHAPYMQRVVPLPWFSDYHILGRVYCNMGTMCHLAGEFELSYEMYKQSAMSFRDSHDSTAYYYALNDMAYELAEQKMHDETLLLLDSIESNCTDQGVRTKLWETKAILYRNIEQPDSVIYAIRKLHAQGNYQAVSGFVMLAQAYWLLNQNDSAIYYAKQVMAIPDATYQNRYNMLYILTYDDNQIGQEKKIQLHEVRDDIDKEILDPLHIQLALSVELIRQDRNKKPNYTLVIIICSIVLLIPIYLIAYSRHKNCIARIKKEEQTLSVKERELSSKAQELSARQQELQQEQASRQKAMLKEFEITCERLRNRSILSTRKGMNNYTSAKKFVNLRFNMLADKLEATHVLSEREILFCVLVLLDVSQLKIAQILTYSPNSIKKTKDIIAKKLGVTSLSLRNYLIDKVFQ